VDWTRSGRSEFVEGDRVGKARGNVSAWLNQSRGTKTKHV
jgi:hypothetical protein